MLWVGVFLSPGTAAPTYYTLSDFQWYVRHADGSKQRTELLSRLSRRQVVVGILWPDAIERNRKLQNVQAFLQQPPPSLPAFRQIKPGPSGGDFATYVITMAEDQSLAGVAVLLNALQGSDTFDYALPVLQLSRGSAAPFIEFTAVFSPRLETPTITAFLRRQPVSVRSRKGTTYSLRLHSRAVTNILVVIRAFEEASNLVDSVEPVWLDVGLSQPVAPSEPVAQPRPKTTAPSPVAAIEARITLDTGWDFPLVDIRQPVTYDLQIDHTPPTHVLPESIAPSALRRALARDTALPPELFDITEAGTQTEALPDERLRTRVRYLLRISKPGTYRIPALQIAYSLEDSRRQVRQLQSQPQQGYLLTVDAHLPAYTQALPGDILVLPRARRLRPWRHHLALGMLAAGLLSLALGLILRKPPRRGAAKPKPLSRRQLRQHYESALQTLRGRTPTTAGPLPADGRSWLREGAALLRRLLGEWATGDATVFMGGAGISKSTITAYLGSDTTAPDEHLDTVLQLLHELDMLATATAPILSPDDYEQLATRMQQTVRLLTHNEVSHVLRTSPGL